ncbi:asparaginase [Actinobacteria bacterium YIM 96077]|uniref:Asparaginase n=1 Tax=Phytoactinopolyspora halophila TaxID=1981511 RepID=A0A329QQC8_9ACTN|nr:asparaginase [Phytoactinopolyspora halophila]AYY14509.1 asparaginase [Actinobacteria bacterium YIM 96077]RAW14111.1 asparaginase [Phytoactinopolyspora halophila]
MRTILPAVPALLAGGVAGRATIATMDPDTVLVAEVIRSGLVESRHHGSMIALHADGTVALEHGTTRAPMYPRSANKPAQAAAMVRRGLRLDPELLALAAASHSGEEFHVAGVRRLLAAAGVDESALRNTPGWPLDEPSKHALLRSGGAASSIVADCSGKHAAMLATCQLNGWSAENYLDAGHPLQVAIRGTIEELAGEPVAHTGVDGCGAPLFAFSLTGLARLFRTMAISGEGTAEYEIVAAIQAHPEYASGTDRDEATLVRAVSGLFGKGGAEAVYAVALTDGRAAALKIDDGGGRARPVVMAAMLRILGVHEPVVDELMSAPVFGGGAVVGEIRPAPWLMKPQSAVNPVHDDTQQEEGAQEQAAERHQARGQ